MAWPPTRSDLLATLEEWVPSWNLRRHMLAVEAAVRAYAKEAGEDEDAWGAVALFHDLDYERHPTLEEHPFKAVEFLAAREWPDWACRAILSHADHTGVSRETALERVLFACDEITGLIVACALVRPDKDLRSVRVRSVKKKWRQASFAAGVSREDVERGAAGLGLDLWEHVATVLAAMQAEAETLELAGQG
ncbi:HD domain-containing protein [bacterium]|nr:HD domain-containing protein [bacterium]